MYERAKRWATRVLLIAVEKGQLVGGWVSCHWAKVSKRAPAALMLPCADGKLASRAPGIRTKINSPTRKPPHLH